MHNEEPIAPVREVHVHKLISSLVAAGLLLAVAASALAKTESVTGKVVDMSCYMKDKTNNAGMDHKMPADTKDCAAACAKQVLSMRLWTALAASCSSMPR